MNDNKRPIPANEAVDTEALVSALVKRNLDVQAPQSDCYFCDAED